MITILVMLFLLPVTEVFVWVVWLATKSESMRKKSPFITALSVALVCVAVAAALYYIPHSPHVAVEGDEADPRGIYILAFGFNGVCGVGVTLALWGLSLILRPSAAPVYGLSPGRFS
jgi:hypothetical protein